MLGEHYHSKILLQSCMLSLLFTCLISLSDANEGEDFDLDNWLDKQEYLKEAKRVFHVSTSGVQMSVFAEVNPSKSDSINIFIYYNGENIDWYPSSGSVSLENETGMSVLDDDVVENFEPVSASVDKDGGIILLPVGYRFSVNAKLLRDSEFIIFKSSEGIAFSVLGFLFHETEGGTQTAPARKTDSAGAGSGSAGADSGHTEP